MNNSWKELVISEGVVHIAFTPDRRWLCGKGSKGELAQGKIAQGKIGGDNACQACIEAGQASRNKWAVGPPEKGE